MFSLLAITLAMFTHDAHATPPTPSGSKLSMASEEINPCQIPVYVNLAGVSNELYPIYSKAIYDAALTWNTAGAGLRFRVRDWNYTGDRKDGAVSVVYTEIDPVNNRIIGYTHRLPSTGSHTIQRARVQINSTDPYCTQPGQTGCYEMFNVVLHELGHALGLPHSDDPSDVMTLHVKINESRRTLSAADIHAVRSRFPLNGAGCEGQEESFAWSKRL